MWKNAAEESIQRIKKDLCEAPVLGMPTEKGMYVLDTDASVVAISGILHQEQEWNGKTVLRPIAYGSKVLSDTEMKYGAPKAEMFAVDKWQQDSVTRVTGHGSGLERYTNRNVGANGLQQRRFD